MVHSSYNLQVNNVKIMEQPVGRNYDDSSLSGMYFQMMKGM